MAPLRRLTQMHSKMEPGVGVPPTNALTEATTSHWGFRIPPGETDLPIFG